MSEKSTLRMENRLGTRILGEQAVEKLNTARKEGTNRYGPRVTGDVGRTLEAGSAAPQDDPQVTVEATPEQRLRAALSALGKTDAEIDAFIAGAVAPAVAPQAATMPPMATGPAGVGDGEIVSVPVATTTADTPPAETRVPGVDQNGDDYTSVREIAAALIEHPDMLDRLIAAEDARESPRKTAYRLFLATEQQKGEAARADVIASLSAKV